MSPQRNTEDSFHATNQWQSLLGNVVEVRLQGDLYRRGYVDASMPDASGLWLAADGAVAREFIEKSSGYRVYTNLYPRSSY